ncbi:MarR family winged helix-turn-helix transcriptional regulator [Glaciihabitans sp. GrIS 2.15]|jgi:DNA-binding MarR family transcriptional regulator|uniref:MarR family winged helix-turn-helix transcriptional regulator n=1 Tax=Glaciihabitans sp. GrIS 2.15 TaxID=3071710 RepID=UPI00199049BB|nr:MarR family transcriptional regulator [Microbacteriaceae bacterium]MEC5167717.1 DNA-binding MarR family transcriptional regulator [Glaciihabitans sp. GrIS 2.15]
MPKTERPLVEKLIVEANRLTRVAAQATGSTTPAAVWRTLSILASDGSYRIGDLAKASRVTQPTMTKLIQNLAEDELIYRIADVADSRAWLIAITDTGTKALDTWRTELGEALQPMFSDLNADEIDILERAVAILESRTNTPRKVA